MRASLNSSVSIKGRRLVHLGVPVPHRIVEGALIGGNGTRVGSLIDGRAEGVATRGRHQALPAALRGLALAANGCRLGSLHQFKIN